MTHRDRIDIALGNLWRMKLRTFLTVSGVLIAIAAFVAMLSFGAGMDKMVSEEFSKLGLFSTIQVYPKKTDPTDDTTKAEPLDSTALTRLSKIPGVRFAYPYSSYDVKAQSRDTTITTSAQALPQAALETKLFSDILAGSAFGSDDCDTALVTTRYLEKLGLAESDAGSLIGEQLVVSVAVVSTDSAFSRLFYGGNLDTVTSLVRLINFDSLDNPGYRSRLLNREFSSALGRFIDGYLNARKIVADTLVIGGVMSDHGRARIRAIILPLKSGIRFGSAGYSGSALNLMTSMAAGDLFGAKVEDSTRSYTQVTLDTDPTVPYTAISDSVEALGFRTFAYMEEFEEFQQVFGYFNLALGMVGLIALLTASLGIVNTMVMSITERRREIGVIKSLGADEGEIQSLFLVESGLIGIIGAAGGIVFGWLISRVASLIAKSIMVQKGAPEMELFALPVWLILAALALGLGVALAAGYFPSSRASRVDPVAALRNE